MTILLKAGYLSKTLSSLQMAVLTLMPASCQCASLQFFLIDVDRMVVTFFDDSLKRYLFDLSCQGDLGTWT